MYLKRLEVAGFKSFSNRTVLELAPGVSAIVGPNGSGKSNLADAIRWALGEQSTKTLRGKKNDELIFAGTTDRQRASLAAVSLTFDNTDGAAPLDYSELELSRLVYRNGESEYRLNGAKVRITEVQQLLAQAGFGTNSYAVIGQGMIDGLITGTPAERKVLFDEASGVRHLEMQREASLRRLESTTTNLDRARDILTELEPRLRTLERSVAAAREHQEAAATLEAARADYLASATAQHQRDAEASAPRARQAAAQLRQLEAQLAQLQQQKQQLESQQAGWERQRNEATSTLAELERQRDETAVTLAAKQTELQLIQERFVRQAEQGAELIELADQIRSEQAQRRSLVQKLAVAEKAASAVTAELERAGADIASAQRRLTVLQRQSAESSPPEYLAHAQGVLKELTKLVLTGSGETGRLRLLVHKASRLVALASRSPYDAAVEAARREQAAMNALINHREEVHERYTKAVIAVRSLELDVAHASANLAAWQQRQLELTEQDQDGRQAAQQTAAAIRQEVQNLKQTLAQLGGHIHQARLQVQSDSGDFQAIFTLARQLEEVQTGMTQAKTEAAAAQADQDLHQQALAELKQRSRQWFGANAPAARPQPIPLADQEMTLAALEGRLAAYTAADGQAAEEYQEVNDRFAFLNEQMTDLEQAKTDLEAVVRRLDAAMAERFEAAFGQLSTAFTKYFQRLFGGGRAGLVLNPEAEGYGIDIQAVPPGKRTNSLAMLSGGERALTGIALLAAILEVNPSPFVVLDEVDAALDEANSKRFADIVAELGRRSQLLIITHNRQTMCVARHLFGVTMTPQQSSRVLTLQLEEASQLAAR